MEKPGIIMPSAAEPARPKMAAGSSGLLSAASRDRGTCRGQGAAQKSANTACENRPRGGQVGT